MVTDYDLVAIGSGSAARTVANACAGAGWRVAVVDHRPLGGTCVLRGCDPKKVLIAGAEAVAQARRMHGAGVDQPPAIDWPALMQFKRGFTDDVPERQARMYAAAGVDHYDGTATFTGGNALRAGDADISSRQFLIATGAEPVPLPIPGAEHLIDSTAFLELDRLPRRFVLVGGGYIAAEFATVAAHAGAAVTILQRGPRLLTRFDTDLVAQLQSGLESLGVRVLTGTEVTAIERHGDEYRVHTTSNGNDGEHTADAVVHAAGRRPALAELQPEQAGVALDDGRLRLNEFLQSTSHPGVWAAGDAAGAGPPLTPVASHEAGVVARNLLEGRSHRPNYRGVPSAVFTLPPLARVGLDEAEANEQGLRFRVHAQETGGWYSSRRLREPVSGYKLLIGEEDGRVLGAHLLGPHAAELINVFALALRHGLAAEHLRDTLYAYPTGASDIAAML